MKTISSLTLALMLLAGFALAGDPSPSPSATPVSSPAKEVYTCPMHPDVVSDHPGKCPQCGMKLVKKKK